MARSYSCSHIQKTLSGVSFFLKLSGIHSWLCFFSVKQALGGYKRQHCSVDSRLPVSAALLEYICAATAEVCFNAYESLLFHVAFSLCFFRAFRISELLPCNSSGSSGFLLSDLRLGSNLVQLFLCRSKTDQLGCGCWITLRQLPGSSICWVSLLRKYLAVRPALGSLLLIHSSGPWPFISLTLFCVNVCGSRILLISVSRHILFI